ncbi:hypothetical protein Droror1_Dr00001319 [Drosera rotundifolia]
MGRADSESASLSISILGVVPCGSFESITGKRYLPKVESQDTERDMESKRRGASCNCEAAREWSLWRWEMRERGDGSCDYEAASCDCEVTREWSGASCGYEMRD